MFIYLCSRKKKCTFAQILFRCAIGEEELTVQKTRAKLVDVARQLFAKKGVEDTTMNDIAVASRKMERRDFCTRTLRVRNRFIWLWLSLNWKCCLIA